MGILVVDDVRTTQDLMGLVAYLTQALAAGEAEPILADGTFTLNRRPSVPNSEDLEALVGMDREPECQDLNHRSGCSCQADAAQTDPRQGILTNPLRHVGLVEYIACAGRGTHEALTECWMCWSDVHRGALALSAALREPE